MTRNPDPLFNLADALSEDIVAAPAETLMQDAASDPAGRARPVASFDRIAARAVAQSRRRRLVERLRTLLHAWPLPATWTSAMAGVAGICVMGIVGGMYFHQPNELRPLAVPSAGPAERLPEQHAPVAGVPMADTGNRTAESESAAQSKRVAPLDRVAQSDRVAESDHAAAVQPAPAAAPPVATPAPPPPASAVAAGVADAPKRVRTIDVPPAPEPPARLARRPPPDRQQPRLDDRVAALALAEEQKRLSPAPFSQAAVVPPAAPKVATAPALAASRADTPPSFRWPVRGRLIAGFGSDVGGVPNSGLDLAVPAGTDIRAAEEGVVLYAGNQIKGLGNLILLRHRDDFITAYAHAKS